MCQHERVNDDLQKPTKTATKVAWKRLSELWIVPYRLFGYIVVAARDGQLLPRITLVFFAHLLVHYVVTTSGPWTTVTLPGVYPERVHQVSLILLTLSGITTICGYALLIALYRHSVQTIFNRTVPCTLLECLPSFSAHLSLLKPLEILFRYATARFRVLPDIIVLGEVRCGTTTLCQHLSSIPGCEPPFCLWKHPELDHKETFYFVGHYLGRVDPSNYRMCFPLALTRWFRQRVLGQPFVTLDACAQYLTNPAVPHLIAKAYRDAGQPPPVLVASVRNPVDQAVSWWRYENNAMAWGGQMGLVQWNTELRTPQYPPLSIIEALEFSSSDAVEEAYVMAENLFQTDAKSNNILPPWAMTWPGGQLTGIGRNGCYLNNIRRYERVFSEAFPTHESAASLVPSTSELRFVNVIPLESLKDTNKLKSTLTSLMSQVDSRRRRDVPLLMEQMTKFRAANGVHRNASDIVASTTQYHPTESDSKCLAQAFSKESEQLGLVTGLKLDWTMPSPYTQ